MSTSISIHIDRKDGDQWVEFAKFYEKNNVLLGMLLGERADDLLEIDPKFRPVVEERNGPPPDAIERFKDMTPKNGDFGLSWTTMPAIEAWYKAQKPAIRKLVDYWIFKFRAMAVTHDEIRFIMYYDV